MAKVSKYTEPKKVNNGELIDLRVLLKGHIVWPGDAGRIVTQYDNGSVMVFSKRHVHVKATPEEFIFCTWAEHNVPKLEREKKK